MDNQELDKLSPEARALFESTLFTETKPASATTGTGSDILSGFERERKTWGGDIKNLAERMRDIAKLIDVQCDLFTYRQNCVERKHELLIELNKYNRKYKVMVANRLSYYNKDYDRKLTTTEKDRMIEGDTSELKYWLDSIEDQVNFFDQVFKNIDNMIFGIKHRIELEGYLRKQ